MYTNMSLSFAICDSLIFHNMWGTIVIESDKKDPNLSVLMHRREIKKD